MTPPLLQSWLVCPAQGMQNLMCLSGTYVASYSIICCKFSHELVKINDQIRQSEYVKKVKGEAEAAHAKMVTGLRNLVLVIL